MFLFITWIISKIVIFSPNCAKTLLIPAFFIIISDNLVNENESDKMMMVIQKKKNEKYCFVFLVNPCSIICWKIPTEIVGRQNGQSRWPNGCSFAWLERVVNRQIGRVKLCDSRDSAPFPAGKNQSSSHRLWGSF